MKGRPMYYGRILALVGVVIGAIGLFLKKASSDGEAALAQLSQIPDSPFPADLAENTWSALYNDTAWAAISFVLILIIVVLTAVMPPIADPMKRLYALTATVMGVLMLLVGIFATLGAMDDADTLEAGFAGAAQQGAIPDAYTVSIGFGWYLLAIAGLFVIAGGVVSLMNAPAEEATG